IGVALGFSSTVALPLFAFAGAAGAIATAILIARAAGGRADPRVLLMAGVIIGAFANAAIMVVLSGAPANTMRSALWWMMGSAAGADWPQARSSGSRATLTFSRWATNPRPHSA